MKKYLAEALGTAVLTLAVGLSLVVASPVSTPLLAALTLGLFVYSIGHISGAHINPAVSFAALVIGKISPRDCLAYLLAQGIGATLALGLLTVLLGETTLAQAAVVDETLLVGVGEFVGMFLFTFGIASVIYGKTPSSLSGIVVGGSLLLGIAVATMFGANGVLNPAVAFGIGSFGVVYVLGPLFGAVFAMVAYKYLQG